MKLKFRNFVLWFTTLSTAGRTLKGGETGWSAGGAGATGGFPMWPEQKDHSGDGVKGPLQGPFKGSLDGKGEQKERTQIF